jgi:hypothetical protein
VFLRYFKDAQQCDHQVIDTALGGRAGYSYQEYA